MSHIIDSSAGSPAIRYSADRSDVTYSGGCSLKTHQHGGAHTPFIVIPDREGSHESHQSTRINHAATIRAIRVIRGRGGDENSEATDAVS